MTNIGANVVLGILAGSTIYIGLVLARWRRMPGGLRPLLALASAGVLAFLVIEVGFQAFEAVETPFKLGHTAHGFASLGLLAFGLWLGLAGLGAWDDRRAVAKGGRSPLAIANMAAVGIGVHNLAEGLAIGQSYATGAAALGASLVAGFALHNATEGFGIIGALGPEEASWKRIGVWGLIAGGPTVLGAVVGGFWTNALFVGFCYALAAGSLLYVVRELFRIPFSISAQTSLAAVTAGLVLGVTTEVMIEAAQASQVPVASAATSVELKIANGKFSPGSLDLPVGANLVIKNADAKVYTLEGAGVLKGDVPVDARGTRTVAPLAEPGAYSLYVEGDPSMMLPVRIVAGAASGANPQAPGADPVSVAAAAGRQPVVPLDPYEPGYAAYTAFNLRVSGENGRQRALEDLYRLSRELGGAQLPAELAQYFTPSAWAKLRPTVAMVIGLGPDAYDAKRFGDRVAASKPRDLHRIGYSEHLGFDEKRSQCDLMVRVVSDSAWFNQTACRLVWQRLAGRLKDHTLDYGYAPVGAKNSWPEIAWFREDYLTA